ncbi:MAG TPA: fused MFS/spermidine synthase [Verrucomicrobiae bacterium]|nr:fused MFS/spermidine synthase [Verrucomicrobiae bacterium]
MTNLLKDRLLYLYAAALLLSAALLFMIQPMVARMILPFLGGSPAVWNTCLFFFQTVLLLGYLYAHLGTSWLGIKRHMILHLGLSAAALYFLPVTVPAALLERADASPVNQVLSALLLSVGFPFFVLSANAPLLQKWFSTTNHPAARDPYFLYAASNAGSLFGLLAYPFWLEPQLALDEQAWFWLYVYLGFFSVALLCGLTLRRVATARADLPALLDSATSDTACQAGLGLFRRLRWIVLSFAPSSLLLGVTTYITTDLASVPLLWVLPLSLYLISFIVAYQRNSWASHPFVVKRQAFLLLAAAITFFATATSPAIILLPLHLVAFFVTCLVCHGELAKDRPGPQHLTEYYLWISFGGVLGGFFNGFLAPLIFTRVQEYPLAMIAAALVRPHLDPRAGKPAGYMRDFFWAGALFIIILGVVLWADRATVFSARLAHIIIFGLSGLVCLRFARRPLRFGLGIGAIMLATSWNNGPFGQVLFGARSFFGVYRVAREPGSNLHVIFHGTTLHGAQNVDPKKRLQPLSYYHPGGPAGQAFRRLAENGLNKPVAVVGLGAGAMACYGKPGQDFVFYEIDALVERIARDQTLFTYLRDCPPRTSVVIGDARLTVARAADHTYGIFVLDAFSGDAIPIHLLTREAVELYVSKLAPDGVLLFHISNRYLDLVPVVDRVAAELKLTAFLGQAGGVSHLELADGRYPSTWVILAREPNRLTPFRNDSTWKPLNGQSKGELWTDHYSNILKVLR